jgi:hypothetical protein
MYGVIFLWKVRPDKLAEHRAIVVETLRAERTRCPDVLLNLTFGPAADGTCAEVQVYADEATSQSFPERVKREDEALRLLWDRYGEVCEPDGWRTIRFADMDFLDESFVRAAAGLGYLAETNGETV